MSKRKKDKPFALREFAFGSSGRVLSRHSSVRAATRAGKKRKGKGSSITDRFGFLKSVFG